MLLAMWVFIFKESLDKLQVFSLSLAYIGVFLLTLMYGHFPWLSVVIALSLGVFIYRKEFNKTYAVSFAFIWLALTVYSAGLFRKARQKHHAVQRVS
jgi:chloramphenicol-sensitive protein RarD